MDPGVAGIIGGAVGSLLTGLVRALGIPSEVREHDAAIRDQDDQLSTWIADRDYLLKRDCAALRGNFNNDSPPPPSTDEYGNDNRAAWKARADALDRDIADARGIALHEYRDQARRAGLAVANVLTSEGWPHKRWRQLRRRPVPALKAPERAGPLLDAWRRPSAMNPARQTWPDDATKRTLDEALGSIPVSGP